MSFEERLRTMMARAEGSAPSRPLDWDTTLTRARRDRTKHLAWVTLATIAVVSLGAVSAYAVLGPDDPNVIAPVGPTESPSRGRTQPTPSLVIEEGESISEKDARAHCSSDGLNDLFPDGDDRLPRAVAEIREFIVGNALSCDYDELEFLALEWPLGPDPEEAAQFTYSYGASGDPAAYWRRLEETEGPAHEDVLGILVKTINLSYCRQDLGDGRMVYQWPSASCDTPTEEQWQEVSSLYTDKEIETMKQFGSFIGYRVGITDDGNWIFYVAGD